MSQLTPQQLLHAPWGRGAATVSGVTNHHQSSQQPELAELPQPALCWALLPCNASPGSQHFLHPCSLPLHAAYISFQAVSQVYVLMFLTCKSGDPPLGSPRTSPFTLGVEELPSSSHTRSSCWQCRAASAAMASGTEQQCGSLTVFSKEDFEEDWVKVASGGFGCVYQVKHKKWRTVYAVKCSPYLLQDPGTER